MVFCGFESDKILGATIVMFRGVDDNEERGAYFYSQRAKVSYRIGVTKV